MVINFILEKWGKFFVYIKTSKKLIQFDSKKKIEKWASKNLNLNTKRLTKK